MKKNIMRLGLALAALLFGTLAAGCGAPQTAVKPGGSLRASAFARGKPVQRIRDAAAAARNVLQRAAVQAQSGPVQAQSGAPAAQPVQLAQTQSVSVYDFEIKQNAEGGITITKYTGKAKNVAIPATISGLTVTTIGRNAFANSGLTNIAIPNGVTVIEAYAFYKVWIPKSALEYVLGTERTRDPNLVIPDSVVRIGEYAFSDCGIQALTLGTGLKTIETRAFSNNEIKALVIPDSVTVIDFGAFYGNDITTLKLGKSLAAIGGYAFYGNNLTGLSLPASLKTIGEGAFCNNKLTEIVIPNGVTYLEYNYRDGVFEKNPITRVTIPRSLAPYYGIFSGQQSGFINAFRGCPITSITLPADVADANLRQFGESFVNFYNLQSKEGGTYLITNRVWTEQ
jgi:hypothetical protein